ncbi:uncharacterized protein ASPGLDRAFT_57413 [Aspergillus glaucus CBS 516.65]|uniref:TLDc domain-containing protein n=1 Tax=Aspergillus glaucus CBS 516.65 TaxID=1160497 RepID=A0A1L9VMY5_ASPGL|nr:hypothetical protein ASPGLDRAFT_57413 [Aspergillus glaucus CBS 516.65]OJJ85244.1 hypothetical protein ASPGLDRAFT_57413 [Aspergillus glaucus CBS 516.65]
MGVSSSQPTLPEGFEFPPPPQNRHELRERYGDKILFRMSGFHSESRLRLNTVFDIFCTHSEPTKFWSESNLANFIQSTFPAELTPILLNAIPVLHQFLLRLGSFPYQNDPDRHLTLDVLKMAITLLLEHDSEQWMVHGEDQASFRVVAFQSMASWDPSAMKPEEQRQRDKEDDGHLEQVLDSIQLSNFWSDPEYPKFVIKGPQLPPSYYPSSWSRDLHRLIPVNEFRSLLQLVLTTRLYQHGIDVQPFATCLPQLENVIDCMLAAFKEKSNNATAISWEIFNQIVEKSMPHFLTGWARLLGPMYSTKFLDKLSPSDSVSVTQALLREAFVPIFQQKASVPSVILDLPTWSQLTILMPFNPQIKTTSLCWSAASKQQLSLYDFYQAASTTQSQDHIILISGNNDQDSHLILGALLSKPSTGESGQIMINRIFQLKQIHRAFRPPTRISECPLQLHDNHASMTVLTKDRDAVNLTLNETSKSGQFSIRNASDLKIELRFNVDAVELLYVDRVEKPIRF